MNFSNNLRYLRREHSMSQDDLANKLGYKSFTTIQKWESGVSEPSVSTVKSIASIFNVTMEQLVNEDLSSNVDNDASPAASLQFSADEERLIAHFRELNSEGQEKLLEYGDDLLASGKYIKSDTDGVVAE